jgi:hypothetical protein
MPQGNLKINRGLRGDSLWATYESKEIQGAPLLQREEDPHKDVEA